jgi:hypothetical protein
VGDAGGHIGQVGESRLDDQSAGGGRSAFAFGVAAELLGEVDGHRAAQGMAVAVAFSRCRLQLFQALPGDAADGGPLSCLAALG